MYASTHDGPRRGPASPGSGARGRVAARAAGTFVFVVLLLAGGCSEWDRYWQEDSVAGPSVASDTTAPTVVVQSPAGSDSANATPIGGDDYEIVILAADNDTVQVVDVYIDDLPPQEITAPPWKLRWDTTSLDEASHHRVRATATDAAGNTGSSAVVYAQVFNRGPQIVITSPPDSAFVRGTIQLSAEFPGETPDIEKVEFVASYLSFEVTSPPWTVDLDTTLLPAGVYYIFAKATDVLGSIGVSPHVRIHVNNGKPTVSIDFPESGHRVASQGTLVLQATATDPEEGTLAPDEVAWRSDLQGDLGTGLDLRKTNLLPGNHTIRAVATNAWGAADSVSVAIEVLEHPTYSYCADIHWPLLEEFFCTFCHQPGSSEYPNSELDLRSYTSLMAGGKSTTQGLYQAVYPCRPESSLVYNKITQDVPWVGNPMPPPPVFPHVRPDVAEKLRVWILEGAPPDVSDDCQ